MTANDQITRAKEVFDIEIEGLGRVRDSLGESFTRTIALIETTGQALSKLKTNVNLQLLVTWLSSQYRRITWQK